MLLSYYKKCVAALGPAPGGLRHHLLPLAIRHWI